MYVGKALERQAVSQSWDVGLLIGVSVVVSAWVGFLLGVAGS